MKTPNLLLATGLLALLIAGCGETEKPAEPPPAAAPANPDLVWNDNGHGGGISGSSGPSSVSETVQKAPDLEFRLELDRREFETDAEIPARLTLKNVSDRPIRIYDPKRCLPADLTFKVYTPDRRTLRIKEHKDIREQSVTEEDLVTLSPGAMEFVSIDLAPTLRSAGHGLTGGYRIWATFTGGHQGKHLSMEVWNRSGGKSLEAPLVLLTLNWPSRLTALGVTPELDEMVSKLLSKVKRDGRPTQTARRELKALGAPAQAALVEKLMAAAARTPDEQLVGWGAFVLLREAGDSTLTALANSPEVGKAPIGRMLAQMVDSDRRRSASLEPTPTDRKFLYLLLDPNRRAGAIFRVRKLGNEKMPGDVFTVFGDGSMHYVRGAGEERTVLTGKLPEKGLDRLFRTVADERAWLVRQVRSFGAAAESRLVFEILERADGVEGPEKSLWRLEVWETEALRFNHTLAALLNAIVDAKLSLNR